MSRRVPGFALCMAREGLARKNDDANSITGTFAEDPTSRAPPPT